MPNWHGGWGLRCRERFAPVNGVDLGVIATAHREAKLDYLVDRFEQNVGPVKLVQAHGPRLVTKVAILSGAGAQ